MDKRILEELDQLHKNPAARMSDHAVAFWDHYPTLRGRIDTLESEIAELRKRRDALLVANNREVEERRAMRAERDHFRRLYQMGLADQRIDAIDGQSAMDEANNRIVVLTAERDEARRQVAALQSVLVDLRDSCVLGIKDGGALDLAISQKLYDEADGAIETTAATAEAYEQRIREDERWKVEAEYDAVIGNLRVEVLALREVLEWGTGGPVAPDYEDFHERARKALDETAWHAEGYELRIRGDERRRMYAAVDALRIEVAEHVEIADDEDVALVAVEILRRARGLQRCVRCDRWGTNLHHTGDDSDLCTDCLADLESEGSDG